MTGAGIKNLVNVAILNAVKEGKEAATDSDFDYAIDRITLGVDMKDKIISEQ